MTNMFSLHLLRSTVPNLLQPRKPRTDLCDGCSAKNRRALSGLQGPEQALDET
jgi:hypothetical protein